MFLVHLPLRQVSGLNESWFTLSWLLMSVLLSIASFSSLENPNLYGLSSPRSPWFFCLYSFSVGQNIPSEVQWPELSPDQWREETWYLEKCNGVGSGFFFQSPPSPLHLMCIFLAFGVNQYKVRSWKGKCLRRHRPFSGFDRDVSHKVWICLFLNISAHAMLNPSVPFLPIYTNSVDNNDN